MSNPQRTKTKRLCFFNHKGGVGKTTLTMNVAAALSQIGRRILLVDSDPQCNLTSYLVAEEVVDDLLDHADTAAGGTIWSSLRPVSEATGGVSQAAPIETGLKNVFLIPGDIRLSEFESDLGEFWGQCLQRKMRGFRGTTALSELVNSVSKQIRADYVFYDCGPNIGPLNRAVLLDCDYFIVPVACDLFSLRALKTVGRTIVNWIDSWSTISELAPEGTYLLPGRPVFLGYVPQGFKIYGGVVARAHSQFLSRIEREVQAQVVSTLIELDSDLAPGRPRDFKLGEIKNYSSLVPASQDSGLPLYEVAAGSALQRQQAQSALHNLATRIEEKVLAVES